MRLQNRKNNYHTNSINPGQWQETKITFYSKGLRDVNNPKAKNKSNLDSCVIFTCNLDGFRNKIQETLFLVRQQILMLPKVRLAQLTLLSFL